MSPVRAQLRATRGTDYRRPGGPWDRPALDTSSRAATDARPRPPRFAPELVRDADVRLRPAELETMIASLAGGLRDLGVRRRDVVAWQLDNGSEQLLLYRACWRLGAIAAPIPTGATDADARALVDLVEPTAVVASAALPLARRAGAILVGGSSLPTRRSRSPEPTGSAIDPPPFAKLLTAEPLHRSPALPTDVAAVLFTRRSDRWIGVVHTHRTLTATADHVARHHGLSDADSIVGAAPLWHVTGLIHGLLAPTLVGARIVLLPTWQATVALDLIERERITVVTGPVAAIAALVHDPDFSPRRVRSIRQVATAGSGATPAVLAEIGDACGSPATHWYGPTEAPAIAALRASAPSAPEAWMTTIAPATELRIVDPATGKDRPEGLEGELWVRGPGQLGGYVEDECNTSALARGGWFRTGDLATCPADEPTALVIAGRADGIVWRLGQAVVAAEVEAVVRTHPAVTDAIVVGVPDPVLGERMIVAIVTATEAVTAPDRRAIRTWCHDQGLRGPQIPDDVVVVPALAVEDEGWTRAALRRAILRRG